MTQKWVDTDDTRDISRYQISLTSIMTELTNFFSRDAIISL